MEICSTVSLSNTDRISSRVSFSNQPDSEADIPGVEPFRYTVTQERKARKTSEPSVGNLHICWARSLSYMSRRLESTRMGILEIHHQHRLSTQQLVLHPRSFLDSREIANAERRRHRQNCHIRTSFYLAPL
jgi:hypothetical protein